MNSYPGIDIREELAKKLHLDEDRIQVKTGVYLYIDNHRPFIYLVWYYLLWDICMCTRPILNWKFFFKLKFKCNKFIANVWLIFFCLSLRFGSRTEERS